VSPCLYVSVFASSRPSSPLHSQRVLPKVGPSSCHETSAAGHPICPDHLVGTRILDEFDLFYLQNDKSKSYGFHVTARSSLPTARLHANFQVQHSVTRSSPSDCSRSDHVPLAVSAAWGCCTNSGCILTMYWPPFPCLVVESRIVTRDARVLYRLML
jgi:hypothetical protein